MPATITTSNVPVPACHCPLCGGPNGCAPALSGNFATPCWCQAQTIDAAARERVPPAQRGRACICERCGSIAK